MRFLFLFPLLFLLAACGAGPVPALVQEATPVGIAVAREETAAASQEETFVGLLTVPYAAGAKVFEFTLQLPPAWRGRYTMQMSDPGTATFLYTGDPAAPVELFALTAIPEATWNEPQATPRTEIAIETLDGVVIAYRLPTTTPPNDEAARLAADVPSVVGSMEVKVAE